MTVASTDSYIQYNGDGVTNTFQIPFYFLLNSDISAIVGDGGGEARELIYGLDFSVSGGGDPEGGFATFNEKFATGFYLLIYRSPPVTQETKYYENGKFPATSHEKALDKLTMLIQGIGWNNDNLSLKMPYFYALYYDAKNKRISNLASPVNPRDAVTKEYADQINSGLKGYIDSAISIEASTRAGADDELRRRLQEEEDARAEADASLQSQLSGGAPLQASAFSPISWHPQIISNSVTIPPNVNAWSFGPTMTIAAGQQVTIGNGSFWTISDGEVNE